MAGAITVSTLKNDTGVFATQNAMTGIPKAWAQYNGVTSTLTNSFNISSVTKTSTGNYTFNFTTAMANTTYAVTSGVGNSTGDAVQGGARVGTYNTTNCGLGVVNQTGSAFVDAVVALVVVGN